MENKISSNFKSELNKQFAIASAKNPELNSIDGVKTKSDFVNSIKEKKEETNEKWSEKYKKSIDCNNPKGFSQRAHCQGRKKKSENKEATSAGSAGGFVAPLFGKIKESLTESERTIMAKLRDLAKKHAYDDSKDTTSKDKIEKVYQELKKQFNKGVKVEKEHKSADPRLIALDHLSEDPKYYDKLEKVEKVEAKEATGSGSSGSYESPSFLAKSMSPKKWRGRSKTQIHGGKFVEVKKKCKKFPYCNQGDINALNLTENKIIKNIIKKLSKEFGVNESIVKKIIIKEYSKK
jgi:hypothetical protein